MIFAPRAEIKEHFSYGFSQGGYAALIFTKPVMHDTVRGPQKGSSVKFTPL